MNEWLIVLIAVGVNAFSNMFSFYLGAKLSRGETLLPQLPGKLEVIEPDEPEETPGYNEIWPKDPVDYTKESN